jgi:hypothetical protein
VAESLRVRRIVCQDCQDLGVKAVHDLDLGKRVGLRIADLLVGDPSTQRELNGMHPAEK